MAPVCERVAEGVFAIDTEFVRPRMDASHLIVSDGHAAFVDTGTFFSVPNLLSALDARDLDLDAVDYVLLTHVHLDHAGGVGGLAAALPRARVLVHPRGRAHIIDPSLIAAATMAVVQRVLALAHDLHADIDEFVRIARRVAKAPDRAERMVPMLFDYLSARLEAHGFTGVAAEQHAVLDGDIGLNAAGLDLWLSRLGA